MVILGHFFSQKQFQLRKTVYSGINLHVLVDLIFGILAMLLL